MLYDCKDIDGFLEVSLVWIHPIYQNLYRTQWPRVGNDIDSRDNWFVYGYVTLLISVLLPLLENFKTLHDLNPSFMKDIFQIRTSNYSSRNPHNLTHYRPNQVTLGTNSLKSLGPRIWK